MRFILKLFIATVLGYFIFFGIIGPNIYNKAVESLEDGVIDHLISIRDIKKKQIEGYFFERRGDVMIMSKDPLVTRSLPLFISSFNENGLGSKQYIDVETEYGPNLTYYTKTYGYEDMFLVDINGNVVFAAVDESYLGINLLEVDFIDPMIPDIFMKGRSKVIISDYVWFDLFNELTAFTAAPVRDRRGDAIGVLLFRLNFDHIDAIMSLRPGLGETGETYLVGEDKLMRSNSRFVDGTTAYQLRVDTEASKEALNGTEGVKVIDDYRGVPVLSAYAPLELENFKWAILAEKDVAEAFASIKSLKRLTYITASIIAVAVAIYGYLAYRKEVRLIEEEQEEENQAKDAAQKKAGS